MCGFVGFFPFNSLGHVDHVNEVLVNMTQAIKSRGPDDFGCWMDPEAGIALAHRRLAIVDLTPTGAQPMVSMGGRYVLAFNGEIYNHLNLRAKLDGFVWRGHSDTETLLAGFEAWGIETTLKRATGMFAFALWDRKQRLLTLGRDRLGEKPLYYGRQGQGSQAVFLFGSDVSALRRHPSFAAPINRDALALYIRHNCIGGDHSIYQGIHKLLPGHLLTLAAGQDEPCVLAWWSASDVVQRGLAQPFAGSSEQVVEGLEVLLKSAVGQQMVADVPLGAFLSGGVDSSIVVALMQAQSSQPVKTFSIGFHEAGYNEAEHAKAVAQHLGTEHTELYVSAQQALDVIPKLPSLYSEPFADSSQIPTYLVSQLARQHVTVSLSGDGGDELFGGYNTYQFLPRVWQGLAYLPLGVRSALQSMLAPLPLPMRLAKLRNVMAAKTPQDLYRQVLSHWPKPEALVLGATEPASLLNSPEAWPSTDSFQHWMMAMDAQTYMVDDVLAKVDRAGMANSLETRIPLLDHRVFEFAWQLPLSMKIRDGQGKWVLREILFKHLPKHMFDRPKKGFSIPLAAWLRGPLRDWAEALLSEQRLRSEGYFDVKTIRMAWHAHLDGRVDHSARLWGVLMFQAWIEERRHA
jgi:asparagine synthase (glutamine-hydrolysing)